MLRTRRVAVAELALTSFAPPDVGFRARVSAGTYLRGLARDVGEALGCGGHLAALTRSEVGPYRLADALPPEQVTRGALRDPAELGRDLPRRELDRDETAAGGPGRPVPGPGAGGGGAERGMRGGRCADAASRG